jgi:hypothetical protein
MNADKKTKEVDKIPETLEECFEQLIKQFSPEQIKLFKNMEEGELIGKTYFGMGIWIRNKWLWENPNSNLRQTINEAYFLQRVVENIDVWRKQSVSANLDIKEYISGMRKFYDCHPDTMSSYIIKAFHRFLNGKDYKDLEVSD